MLRYNYLSEFSQILKSSGSHNINATVHQKCLILRYIYRIIYFSP